jgi:hypothetical protein
MAAPVTEVEEPAGPGPTADPAGWYCFSTQARLAEWDGTAWTGSTHGAWTGPWLPGPPAAFAFLRLAWLRWMAVGQALVILPAVLSGTTGSALWSWMSVVGYAAFMTGAVLLVARFLDLDGLEGRRSLTWIGIGSGVAAFGIGFGLEVLSSHLAGWSTTLWLTGPIEEGGKLLVPLLLLAFGAPRFRVPRIGLYLVLVSGATVGALEGVEYEARPEFPWAHLEMALLRPSAELLHVFITGFAAAVIWLAAWRSGRILTAAGAVAFLIAAGIHSFHDGIITFFNVNPRSFNSTLAQSLHDALAKGLSGGVFALGIAALCYLLARHGARELTPPGDIVRCPPPWRPQLKAWGCDPRAMADPVAPVGAWSTYGTIPYGTATYAQAGYGPAFGAPAHAAPSYGAPGAPVGSGAPVQAGVPLPVTGPTAVPELGLRELHAAPPPAPPGWYTVGGDPALQGWWTGATWTRYHRWNGYAWQPT